MKSRRTALQWGSGIDGIKNRKGNANYSIRPIELTPYNRNIIEQMLALHEPSPYLFTCQGRPLITDTFNKRLKKYTTEIDIPYLSTHKLRFTSASLAKRDIIKYNVMPHLDKLKA